MEAEAGDTAAPTARLSVDDIPDNRRFAAVRDYLAGVMRVELDPLDNERPFRYRADLRLLPGVSFGDSFASGVVTHRTRQLVKDAQDDLVLVMPETRMTVLTPDGIELVIEPGEAVLMSQAREMRLVHHDTAASWAARVAHKEMAKMLPRLSSAPVLAIRKDSPMLSLLSGYRRFVLATDPLAGAEAQRLVARHLQEIMAGAIGASADYLRAAEDNAVSAVRLRTIKGDIEANLGAVHLNLDAVAARHGLSPRHVQRLFAREGTSFSDFLRAARLARVRALLEEPRNAGRTISAIALECGFPEASTMNRAFREAYGMTPSEMRRGL